MITLVVFLLILATVPLFGGRLALLARLRPVRGWAIGLSVALQVVIFSSLGTEIPLSVGVFLHFASYGFALAFVQANWRIPGMLLLVSGGLLNLVAITANGGVMPARFAALETAGLLPEGSEFRNSNFVADAKLAFLGDVFAIPEGIPFANVFSIGDVVLVIGGGILVHKAAGSTLRRSNTNLRLAPGMYPAVDSLLGFLAEASPDAPAPTAVELVNEARVAVSGPSRKPILVLGIPLLSMITLDELRALAVRATIRRAFGASEAFDLADEHELEASELAAQRTSAKDLSFGLMVQASMQSGHPGPAAVIEHLGLPVDAVGPTLSDHLRAIDRDIATGRESIANIFSERRGSRSADIVLTASPLVSAPKSAANHDLDPLRRAS